METSANSNPGMSNPITRRQMVGRLGGGLGAIGLLPMLDTHAVAAASPHFRPRAKRIIHLFMNGGPFQADFFDPKPSLTKYAGQRPKEVELRTERATAGLLASPFQFAPRGKSGVP